MLFPEIPSSFEKPCAGRTMTIEGRPANLQQLRDLCRLVSCCEELARSVDLVRRHRCFSTSASTAFRSSCCQAGDRTLLDQLTFHLGNRGQDAEQ